MQIKVNLQEQDWLAFQRHIARSAAKKNNAGNSKFWKELFTWMAIAIIFTITFQVVGALHWPTVVAVSVIFIVLIALYLINLRGIRSAFKPSQEGIFCGEHEFNFHDDGFDVHGKGYHSHMQWCIVKRIERTNGMILMYLDSFQASIIPERDLDNPDELYQFISNKVSAETKS